MSLSPRPRSDSHCEDPEGLAPATRYAQDLLAACGLDLSLPDSTEELEPAAEWAQSGAMALTGYPGAAPRFAPGPLATAARGVGLALEALAPKSSLRNLDTPALLAERAALAGLVRRGSVSAGGSARLLPTRTGWIAIHLPRAEDWSLLAAWLDSETGAVAQDDWETISTRVARTEGQRLIERAHLLGLAVANVAHQIDSELPLFRLESPTQKRTPRKSRPLRLLDLSSLWAGPLATSLLAMSGIDVLKIESPTRPDGARQGPRDFFDLMNGNKEGCALDLTRAPDRAHFARLLAQADVVFESARPRAMEQLGFDATSWTKSIPGRLWVSMTGYGRSSPERDWIAYGDDAAVAAGLGCWSTSPKGGSTTTHATTPCFCADAIADPLAGLHAAAIVLAHLHTGRGGVVDLSLVNISSKAGGFSAGRLDRPIERAPNGKGWIIGEGAIPVLAPRARARMGTAPALVAPNRALISKWTGTC